MFIEFNKKILTLRALQDKPTCIKDVIRCIMKNYALFLLGLFLALIQPGKQWWPIRHKVIVCDGHPLKVFRLPPPKATSHA